MYACVTYINNFYKKQEKDTESQNKNLYMVDTKIAWLLTG